ncbi:RTA1 like protein-domain-containing protein [Geopyxis carbonaria]|nr:RTA1 like protein-domain-containing protein [Geopyxis carbonaria]
MPKYTNSAEWHTKGYYAYEPSYPTAIVGAVLFSLTGAFSIFQYFFFRSWYFWCIVLASLMEMIGFIARAPSANNPTSRPLYITQFCLIILAPAVLAAGLYMTFGRIISATSAPPPVRQLWVPARFVTPIFVAFDVVSFTIQLIGAAMLSSADATDFAKIDRGGDIIKIGLAVQLVGFGFFTVVGLRWAVLMKGESGGEEVKAAAGGRRRLAWAVNGGCLLVLVRSVYRMAEFAGGRESYLKTTEVWFWVLDAMMLFFVFVLFNVFHPATYIDNIGFRNNATKTRQGGAIELGNSE